MEEFNQMDQVSTQTPIQDSALENKGGLARKIIWVVVGVIIVLLIVLAVLATIGTVPSDENLLTEEEKSNLLESLESNSNSTLNEEQQSALVDSLEESSSPELSQQEKQDLLDSLQQ